MGNGELLTQPPWKNPIQELGVGGKNRCVRACDAGVGGPSGLVLGDFRGDWVGGVLPQVSWSSVLGVSGAQAPFHKTTEGCPLDTAFLSAAQGCDLPRAQRSWVWVLGWEMHMPGREHCTESRDATAGTS